MAKTTGQFDYRIRKPKIGATPLPAIVHIIPKAYTTEDDEWPLLSPGLASEQEIDGYVQECKEDLDHVGRLAKRALQRHNQKTHELVKDKDRGSKEGTQP